MAFRLLLALSLLRSALALWPTPNKLSTGNSSLLLAEGFYIDIGFENAPSDLREAVWQTQNYLETDRLGRLVVGRGKDDNATLIHAPNITILNLLLTQDATANSIASESVKPLGTRSEEYILNIPADGSNATLKANSTLGLFRGLTTFTQLWYHYAGNTYTLEAPIEISDKPAYPYRGFLLDTSRNYYPVKDILRTLDAMSWVKMSMFHWHITDSQSFPLDVIQLPKLAAEGAYSADETYTTSDVQHIVQYAAARGIDVMMEVDMPGHTAAIGMSYSEHVACFHETPWEHFANEPPAGQLRFALPNTTDFAASLLRDVASTLPSRYFGTGGDELNTNCYDNDTVTQQQLKSTNTSLQQALATFTNTTHTALNERGKIPVVWEEMVLHWNLTLSKETIVLVWISSQNARNVTELGYHLIHVPSDYYYLDCGDGGWLGNYPNGTSWCLFSSWSKAYIFDPLANISKSHHHLVLGGQHALWSEQSASQNLDSIVWPRGAVSAETYWSGAQPNGEALNVSEALPRIHDLRFRMVQRGVKANPLQPLWCALRPGKCDKDPV